MRRLRFRPAARADVQRLALFLAEAPPNIAEEMVRRLETRAKRLLRFPYLGRKLSYGDLRETVVAHGKSRYIIRYQITRDAVRIVRIWHGKENRPR